MFSVKSDSSTSVALALDPSLVDPSGKHLPTVEREPLWVTRGLKRASHQVRGYWGAPKEASVERGQAEFKKIVERAFPRLKSHLSGVFSPSAFRSWYSIIPSNRSFFKSWILALAVLIAFAIFASLTFQIK